MFIGYLDPGGYKPYTLLPELSLRPGSGLLSGPAAA